MNELQLAGLIVVSAMSILLFWRMICIEKIEESLQSFFIGLFETLWTLFQMLGFFFGFGWSVLIMCYLYTTSGKVGKIKNDQWRRCVEVSGILTVTTLLSIAPLLEKRDIGGIAAVYALATLLSIAVYHGSDSCNWDYSSWKD